MATIHFASCFLRAPPATWHFNCVGLDVVTTLLSIISEWSGTRQCGSGVVAPMGRTMAGVTLGHNRERVYQTEVWQPQASVQPDSGVGFLVNVSGYNARGCVSVLVWWVG